MREGRVFEVLPNNEAPYEDDVEAAFDEWRKGFEDAESPGNIRAFRIPLDEQGRASHSASGQVRLGSWPVDQYDFDALCDKIMREYMLPTENTMAVRLIGTLAGKAGVRFNKIVVLQRPNTTGVQAARPAQDGISDIMRSMQESNERMMRMFQEMRGPGGSGSDGGPSEMMRTVAMMRVMMEPMMGMMGPVMAAVAGRPVPAAAPASSMKEMLETLMLADRFLGKRGGGGSSEPDWVKVTTAVAGVAGPLLQMAANRPLEATRTRKQSPQIAPTQQPTQPVPAAAVASQTPPTVAPPQKAGVDLSRPSPLPPGSLSTGVDINAPSSQIPEPNMFAETKKQIDAFVEVARSGADPTAVANEFFDGTMLFLDETNYGRMAAMIEGEGFLASLSVYNTQAKDFAPFFTAMRTQLMQRIIEEDTGTGS